MYDFYYQPSLYQIDQATHSISKKCFHVLGIDGNAKLPEATDISSADSSLESELSSGKQFLTFCLIAEVELLFAEPMVAVAVAFFKSVFGAADVFADGVFGVTDAFFAAIIDFFAIAGGFFGVTDGFFTPNLLTVVFFNGFLTFFTTIGFAIVSW